MAPISLKYCAASGGYFPADILKRQLLRAFSLCHFRRIILPNIVSSALPLIGNQLIICLKDTAFLSIITVQEITAAANSVRATYFIPFNALSSPLGFTGRSAFCWSC